MLTWISPALSLDLGSSHDVWPDESEPYDNYLRRVWDLYRTSFSGRDTGEEWGALSELLHGRLRPGAPHGVRLNDAPQARQTVHELTIEVAELALRQIRGALATAFSHHPARTDRTDAALRAVVDDFPAGREPDFLHIAAPALDWKFD